MRPAHLVPAAAPLALEPFGETLTQRLRRTQLLTQAGDSAQEALLIVLVLAARRACRDVGLQSLGARRRDLLVEVVPEVVQHFRTRGREAELLQLRAGRRAHHDAPAP